MILPINIYFVKKSYVCGYTAQHEKHKQLADYQ